MEALRVHAWQMMDKMTTEYRADLKAVSEHCEKELSSMSRQFTEDLRTFRDLAVMLQEWIDQHQNK